MKYLQRSKIYCPLIVSILFAFSPVFIAHLTWSAQETGKEGHTEKAPHQGQLLDTGEKHVEFLVKGGKEVYVYLYDKNLKPISAEGIEGVVYFRLTDNSRRESKLAPVKEKDTTFLKGNVDLGTKDYSEAVVSLKRGDKKENLRFGHPAGQEHHQ
ncbi:MAG TPA: hypothetical protein VNM22_15990 [Candidatus Limnocylindrales bacterium]|nr:hypothetical protein [Candidatus Limnocylindrales bacterium]